MVASKARQSKWLCRSFVLNVLPVTEPVQELEVVSATSSLALKLR